MNTQTIMIQVGERTWTVETLHSACILARKTGAEIALVKMIPVQHLSWLGTDFGYRLFTEHDRQELHDYELTLEDYGIQFSINVIQYTMLIDALVQAAKNLDAQVVFAQLPKSPIPYWHQFQTGMLRRRLVYQHRQLFEQPAVIPESLVEEAVLASQP